MLNDIAILVLNMHAPLSSTIQLACLPTSQSSSYPSSGSSSWAVGWGLFYFLMLILILDNSINNIYQCFICLGTTSSGNYSIILYITNLTF